MKKRVLAALLTIMLLLGLSIPAAAYDMGKVGEDNVLSCGSTPNMPQSAVINPNNSLWAWGYFDFSHLSEGPGRFGGYYSGYETPQIELEDIVSVSCGGGTFTAVIKKDGSLWLWGNNSDGEIGIGKASKLVWDPTKIMEDVAAVSCGDSHAAAIKTDGSLWVWGSNSFCNLGIEEEEERDVAFGTSHKVLTPTRLMSNVVAVSCGSDYTAAIKTDGSLWTWGRDYFGALGSGGVGDSGSGPFKYRCTPTKVLDDVVAVSCGAAHTAAIQSDGSLWMWGNNSHGELGLGNDRYSYVPIKMMDHVVAVSCGDEFTAAIKADGTLWMWGDNEKGQLGNGRMGNEGVSDNPEVDRPYQTLPVKVLDNVSAVRCGKDYTAAIQSDGSLWTWGQNDQLQLGNEQVYDFRGSWGIRAQTVPMKILDNVAVPAVYDTPLPVEEPKEPVFPDEGIAYPSTQEVDVDGKAIEFQCYALKDANGYDTNYIKLRDLAAILNGTAAQFEVDWDGDITITTGQAYTPNGTEHNTPFGGERAYQKITKPTRVNSVPADLDAFQLKDDNGGGYTYYKLRDLGAALGITVDRSAERGIYIETK